MEGSGGVGGERAHRPHWSLVPPSVPPRDPEHPALSSLPGFLPLAQAPAFPCFFGSINASLHALVLFVLTEHPSKLYPACLLHGAVLPDSLFHTQAQGAKAKSEFNVEALEAEHLSRKDRGSKRLVPAGRPHHTHPKLPCLHHTTWPELGTWESALVLLSPP